MSDTNAPAGGGTPGIGVTSDALQKMIDEAVNRAVGSRLNRKTLDALVADKVTAMLGGDALSKQVEAAILKFADSAPTDGQPGTQQTQQQGAPGANGQPAATQPGAQPGGQDDPRWAEFEKQRRAMEQQLQQLQQQLKTEKDAATKAAAAAKEARLFGHVKAQLAQAVGGNQHLASLLAKELVADKGWIVENSDGSFGWRVQQVGPMGDTVEQVVSFEQGFDAWVKNDGKAYVPARPQQAGLPPMGMGMPFPIHDPTGSHPSTFVNGQPRPGQQPPTFHRPVLAQIGQDMAPHDPTFASGAFHMAQQPIGPNGSGTPQ